MWMLCRVALWTQMVRFAILCSTICVHSATRPNIHMYPYHRRPKFTMQEVILYCGFSFYFMQTFSETWHGAYSQCKELYCIVFVLFFFLCVCCYFIRTCSETWHGAYIRNMTLALQHMEVFCYNGLKVWIYKGLYGNATVLLEKSILLIFCE